MPIAFGGALGSNTNKTTGTTVTATTGSIVPVGSLVVVIWGADNLTATTPTLSSVTDTKNNVYSVIGNAGSGTATAAAGQVAGIAVSRIATELSATDTISAVASSASTVVKAMDVAYFTGASSTVRATATTATGNSTAPSVNYTSGLSGDVVLGAVANQNNALPTGDADTTNGSWGSLGGIASTGGNAGTNISIFSQYKILTASGSQTYNVTITSGQWSILAVALTPAPTLSRTATGSGLGTQSATGVKKKTRTATGSGTGTQSATFNIKRTRTATGSGSSAQTTVRIIKKIRTATGSGIGSQTTVRVIKRIRTASGSGVGSSSTIRVRKVLRTSSGSGSGTSSSSIYVLNKAGIEYSYWGLNARIE